MQDTAVKQSNKAIKITKITLSVIFYIFIALLLLFSISTLRENKDTDNPQIPNIFGIGFLNVHPQADSMEGDNKETSIYRGDLIFVKTLTLEQKLALKKGDVVTFFDTSIQNTDGTYGAFNTHRINTDPVVNGQTITFYTKGDNPKYGQDSLFVTEANVVAIYNGSRIGGFGNVVAFMQTRLGFGLIVILPVLLMLIYNGYLLMNSVFLIKKEKLTQENEADREKMKAELLEQLRKEQELKEQKTE